LAQVRADHKHWKLCTCSRCFRPLPLASSPLSIIRIGRIRRQRGGGPPLGCVRDASAPRQMAVPSRFFNAAKSVLMFILQQEPAGTIRREPLGSASAVPLLATTSGSKTVRGRAHHCHCCQRNPVKVEPSAARIPRDSEAGFGPRSTFFGLHHGGV
jgi:hypothetical protein